MVVVFFNSPVARPERATPLSLTTVAAFEPDVVTSPDISDAVIAVPEPRSIPVNVLTVPVPPWLTGRAAARWVAVTWLEVLTSVPVLAIDVST